MRTKDEEIARTSITITVGDQETYTISESRLPTILSHLEEAQLSYLRAVKVLARNDEIRAKAAAGVSTLEIAKEYEMTRAAVAAVIKEG